MKRTKILATLGPASSTKEIVRAMVDAGVNAFRINMSHGTHEQWQGLIETIRSVTKDAPIIVDTTGPELRLMNVPQEIHITAGQEFLFSLYERKDMAYSSHPFKAAPGHIVLFDDGAIAMLIERIENNVLFCCAQNDGVLTERRKITVPDSVIDLPVLSKQDYENLAFCLNLGIDGVALSFTQSAADVLACRAVVGPRTMIIAKIENHAGVANINHIIAAADAVMVARGDLGVEIPIEEVPQVQKQIVKQANVLGKPVIVATQMLESMTESPSPTRAEVSDVANAILDGADCIMLSGETARGKYPVQTVNMMARIAEATDSNVMVRFERDEQGRISAAEAISAAVYDLATNLHADAIVSATSSGFTARMVARFRPQLPVIGVAHDEHVKRLLALSWGVVPCVFTKENKEAHETIPDAVRSALEQGLVRDTDFVVATAGVNTKARGSTNLIEVHHVKDLLTFHQHI